MYNQGFNLTKEQRAGTWGYNAYGEDCRIPWVQWSQNEKSRSMLALVLCSATFILAIFVAIAAWYILVFLLTMFVQYVWPGLKKAAKQQIDFLGRHVLKYVIGVPCGLMMVFTTGGKAPDPDCKDFRISCWATLLLLLPCLASYWNLAWEVPVIWLLWYDLTKKHPME